MNAFIAWTPLHIINILNTVINYYPDSDNSLFIYDEFDGAHEIFEKLNRSQIFGNIYLIDHQQTGNTIEKIGSLLFNKQKFIFQDKPFDHIFIQGENYFAKLLYGEAKKKNKDVHLHYIEDGLGAYVGSPILRIDNKGNRFIRKMNRHSIFRADITSYYVYEPNLILCKMDGNYFQLPKLVDSNPAISIIRNVFDAKDSGSERINSRILFFDQPFLKDGYSIDEFSIVDALKKIVFPETITVKYHPRSPKDKYSGVNVLKTGLPWEIYCLNSQLEDVVLLSIATTASFTPYLMFGIKLPVVMLSAYYLSVLPKNKENERTLMMLKNTVAFTDYYMQQTEVKVYQPLSMAELSELLLGIPSETD